VHGRRHGFFPAGGGAYILERYFNLAWIWRARPGDFLPLDFDELVTYEEQTARLIEEQRMANDRAGDGT
jgi:hypothetical protein